VSGVSERIMPTIVKQFENKIDSENKKEVGKENKVDIDTKVTENNQSGKEKTDAGHPK